jgi:hypothetical protein
MCIYGTIYSVMVFNEDKLGFGVFILLGCYAAYVGSFFTDVSGQHMGPISKDQAVQDLILEDGPDILSQNVGKLLPTYAAQQRGGAKTSPTP